MQHAAYGLGNVEVEFDVLTSFNLHRHEIHLGAGKRFGAVSRMASALYISGICAKDVCTLMELLPSLRKAHGIGAACGRSQYAGAGEHRRNEQSM